MYMLHQRHYTHFSYILHIYEIHRQNIKILKIYILLIFRFVIIKNEQKYECELFSYNLSPVPI